jgi:hypothetical protein
VDEPERGSCARCDDAKENGVDEWDRRGPAPEVGETRCAGVRDGPADALFQRDGVGELIGEGGEDDLQGAMVVSSA